MCGICGIINLDQRPVHTPDIEKMNNLANHRGPDGEGYFIKNNIGLGHRRLAIIDLSDQGRQPYVYHTPDGRQLVVVHNGEIYNYLELKNELKQAGYHFRSQTDTEVLVAAYDYWGKDCVNRFNGMWAFALYDEVENELFCSRDRYGIKPFYYTTVKGKFCFASEIKQFTVLEKWHPRVNKTRVWEFLNYGYHDHTTETLFDGIMQIGPATNLVVNTNSGKFEVASYCSIGQSFHQYNFSSSENQYKVFSDTLTDSIRLHLRADVKTGTSLSGGLDSSSIVAAIQAFGNGVEQSTVSAVFPGYEKDESPYLKALCEKLHLQNLKVTPTFTNLIKNLDKLVWHQDEPFSSASIFAQYMVYQKASHAGLKVMLDGQGADEILCGYDKFYVPYFKDLVKRNPLRTLLIAIDLMRHQQSTIQAFREKIVNQGKANAKMAEITATSFQPEKNKVFQRSDDDTLRACSINLIQEVGLRMLLRYQDRNSMAFSVESRVPFLDYRLVERCLALPDELKIKHGIKKYVLHKTMENKLPKIILKRRNKLAFDVPELNWIMENPGWFWSQLTEAIEAHPSILSQSVLAHLKNLAAGKKKDYGSVWRVITFHRWSQLFGVDTQC